MKLSVKISRFDDVPEVIDDVHSWKVSDRETLSVTTPSGMIVYPSTSWTRLEEIDKTEEVKE